MVTVYVEFRGEAKRRLGIDKLTVELPENASFIELLEELERKFGWSFKDEFVDESTGSLSSKVVVLVNKTPLRRDFRLLKLKNGDTVVLFPHTVCGG
jgi:molybdopterin converting factor small subunit